MPDNKPEKEPKHDEQEPSLNDLRAELKVISDKTFPEPKSVKFAFPVPFLILGRKGHDVTLRQGGAVQLEHEIEECYCFAEDLDRTKDYPMGTLRTSSFKLMGKMIRVLDDKSAPTAAEYLELIGKRTLWESTATELPNRQPQLTFLFKRPVYRVRKVYVTPPESL